MKKIPWNMEMLLVLLEQWAFRHCCIPLQRFQDVKVAICHSIHSSGRLKSTKKRKSFSFINFHIHVRSGGSRIYGFGSKIVQLLWSNFTLARNYFLSELKTRSALVKMETWKCIFIEIQVQKLFKI